MTDKPAQSDAPSAEEWLALQSLNGKRLILTTQQQDNEAYMNVQQAMEAYAALRTAKMAEELKQSDTDAILYEKNYVAETAKVAQLERERDSALDILWKDIDCERDRNLTLEQVAAKSSNAIYWRNERIAEFVKRIDAQAAALSEARALLTELATRWGVRSGECNTCDLLGGKHSGDCPIPRIKTALAGASGAAGKGGSE